MCGILGIRKSTLSSFGHGEDRRLRAAIRAMAWRGPDGSEHVEAGEWILAASRLTITDAAHGQPLWSHDGRRVILFNGAVTSAAVERVGTPLRTGNDAELPLHRLANGGSEALLETSGHYALAILEPATDQLWLARDPEGEKPLHIVRSGGRVIAFASTLSSLRELGFPIEFPREEQARFLRFGFDLGPSIADPAHSLQNDLRGVAVHREDEAVETRSGSSRPVHAPNRSLKERLTAAVDRCAEAAVPVGMCLSGGVDSSCIASALHASGRSVPAFQFCAVGESTDEREAAREVAQLTGMDWRPVDGGPEILQRLPDLIRRAGRPLGDPSVLAVHALGRAASSEGVRVMLSGEGADELFLGYRRHRAARRLPRVGFSAIPRRCLPQVRMSTWARSIRAVASRAPYDSLLEVAPPGFRNAVLAPEFARGSLPETAVESTLDRARRIDREYYLRHDLLPKLDTALMAAGIEGRCPFLDPEVIGSDEARSDDPRVILGKRQLREAFRADLPARILDGRKRGFGIPLDRWLREDDFLSDVLRDRVTLERRHILGDGLEAMLDRHRAGRCDVGHALYLVAALELYLREWETTA